MKYKSSLQAVKKRDKNNRLIKRNGKLMVINKKNPRMKVIQA
jgi:large subunit ribosomal protein L36